VREVDHRRQVDGLQCSSPPPTTNTSCPCKSAGHDILIRRSRKGVAEPSPVVTVAFRDLAAKDPLPYFSLDHGYAYLWPFRVTRESATGQLRRDGTVPPRWS
jgi:hypothetical protein